MAASSKRTAGFDHDRGAPRARRDEAYSGATSDAQADADRHRPRAFWTGRSEKLNSTASSSVS